MQTPLVGRQSRKPKLVVFETRNRKVSAAALASKNAISEAMFALQWRETNNQTARKLVIIDRVPELPTYAALVEE